MHFFLSYWKTLLLSFALRYLVGVRVSKYFMFTASNHIPLIHLWVSSEKTLWNVGVDVPFPRAFCKCKVSASIQWTLSWSFHSFIFHHSHHFLVAATWNARAVIYGVVTCIKLIFNITAYILEEVFSFDLIAEAINVCEEKLCTISIFWFNVVVLEIIYKTLADIRILILQYTGSSNTSFVFFVWILTRFKTNIMQCLKFGFAASVITNLRLLTKLRSMQFLMFSKSFRWQSYSSTWRNHSWIQSLLLQRYSCWAQYISSTKIFRWNFFLCDSFASSNSEQDTAWSSYKELCISPYHTGLAQAFQLYSPATSEGQVDSYYDHHEALFNIQDPPWGCKVLISSCQNQ